MGFTDDVPAFFCHMKAEYAYDLKSHHGDFFDVWVVNVDSVPGRSPGFTCITSFGAMFDRLPISAFVHDKNAPDTPLSYLCLWDSFSAQVEAREWANIRNLRVGVSMKNGDIWPGVYQFSLSWWGSPEAENSGSGGFKRGHVIKADNGCYLIQPGNRMRWFEPAFITEPFPSKPDFKTNSHNWSSECTTRWSTSDNDDFFYQIKELDGKVTG